ncbi:MAG TPA: tetratricopeptide repeat protein [Dongiaceae bacterium]
MALTGRVGCLIVCLVLIGCAAAPVDPKADIPPQLADVTPMSQREVDEALTAPELARAVKDRAAYQPQAMVQEFRSAAEQGNAIAQYQLAQLYRQGTDVPQDDKVAFDYARMAAEEGLGEAEIMLAESYLAGRGVGADRDLGLQWLRLAEAQTRPAIWVMAGMLYLEGVSTAQAGQMPGPTTGPTTGMPSGNPILALPADPTKALSLFQRAADIGNENGELALCLVYMKGRVGSAPSPKDGQPWCDRAAARGNLEARNYSTVAPRLQPQEEPTRPSPLADAVETVLVDIGTGIAVILYIAIAAALAPGNHYSCC